MTDKPKSNGSNIQKPDQTRGVTSNAAPTKPMAPVMPKPKK